MKNLFIIIVIITLTSCKSIKKDPDRIITGNVKTVPEPKFIATKEPIKPFRPLSEFNGDTLRYVQTNFLNRQKVYINKPFKVFLSDLEIPIKSFLSGSSGKSMNLVPNIILEFYTYTERNNKIKNRQDPILLIITWVTPLDDVYPLQFKSQGVWTSEVNQYFSDKIVARIDIIKYNF